VITASGDPKLAVVGAINIDLVVTAARLPGPGDTVVGSGPLRFGGGKGANAAVAAARVGAEVVLVGAVGADAAGTEALSALRAEGIDLAGVSRIEGESTGTGLIVVDEAGENQIAVGAGANQALPGKDVRAALEPRLEVLGAVLVSTEIADEAVDAAVELAVAAGIPCVLNPAPPTEAAVRACRRGAILTPNVGELSSLLDRFGEPRRDDVVEELRALAGHGGAPMVVTRGAAGVVLCDEGDCRELPAPLVDPVDTTGAGDTFNGVFTASLAGGRDLRAAAELAVAAAAISVGAPGARDGMPTLRRIEAASTAAG